MFQKKILLSNGDTILLNKGIARLGPRIHVDDIYVDGNDLSGLSTAVLRDRQILSEDGMVSVLISMDSHEGKLLTKPVIISRGFVYMKDSFPMIREAENLVGQALSQLLAGKKLLVKSKIQQEMFFLNIFIVKQKEIQ